MNVNKRQAFLEEKYVLLTPETHWYPVAALNYYPGNPAQNKNRFYKVYPQGKKGSRTFSGFAGKQKKREWIYPI